MGHKKKITILGAGLSGLSCAYFLKRDGVRACLFEKEAAFGGLCRSRKVGGFTFDTSGHLLHFRNPKILSFVRDLLKDDLRAHKRDARIYTHNRLIPYPFQTNFHRLGRKVAEECILGLMEAHHKKECGSFLDWINERFGKGIAGHFMVPYNTKFWKTPLEGLIHEGWADRFIATSDQGYSAIFRYPSEGGIGVLTKAFGKGLDGISTGREAKEIDLKKSKITFKEGGTEGFDTLVSTIPLPELGRVIKDLPEEIRRAFERLRWVSIYNINLGIEGGRRPKEHWIYFPGEEFKFFRAGFFHNFSSRLAPPGGWSMYTELSYTKERPIEKEGIARSVKEGLERAGILGPGTRILCEEANDISYGYPLYDKNYAPARKRILNFLLENNVVSRGRYGSWRYYSMEDVILESMVTAECLCGRPSGIFSLIES